MKNKKMLFKVLSKVSHVLITMGIFCFLGAEIPEAQAAAPAFRGAGAVASNAGAVAVVPNATHQTNDVELLFVETSNQAANPFLSTAAGFVELTNVSVGAAAAANATRLTVFWRRWDGSAGSPTVGDSSDHQIGRIISYSGVITSGNPWDAYGSNTQPTAATAGSVSAITATVADTLVVVATAGSLPDTTGTTQFSAWTNANLIGLTERIDNSANAGNGGALGVADGIKSTIGSTGATTFTSATVSTKASMHIALKGPVPPEFSVAAGDIAFNNTSPVEDSNVKINATIHNNGPNYNAVVGIVNFAGRPNGALNATTGSFQGAYYPYLANDGLASNGWASSYETDWVMVDMNTTKYVKNVAWNAAIWASANQPGAFTMSLSADNITWTEVCNVTGYAGNAYNTTLTTPIPARYLRMNATSRVATNAVALCEIYSFDIPSVAIDFYDGNPDAGGIRISTTQFNDSIASGGTVKAEVTWNAVAGNHDIYVIVDKELQVTETDETNNTAYKNITVSGTFFNQSAYRWFDNLNSTDVGAPLAAQDTPVNLTARGQQFRLRMLLNVSDVNLSLSGRNFNLQFAPKGAAANCSEVGSANYSNVEVLGQNWTQHPNAAWGIRDYPLGAVFNDKIFVFSGLTANYTNDSWSTTDGNNWTLENATCAWRGREKAATTVFNNSLWILGGFDGSATRRDAWYSNDGARWTQANATCAWPARSGFASITYNDKIWVLGGIVNGNTASQMNDSWYSSDGATWTQANATCAWAQRTNHAAVVFNNKMWVMGGWNYNTSTAFNDVWYSTDGGNWTQATAAAPWAARSRLSIVVYENKMWLVGGGNDIWHSTDGVNWTSVGTAPWTSRSGPVAVNYDNKLWCMGGYDIIIAQNDTWHTPTKDMLFNDNPLPASGGALTINVNDPTLGGAVLRNQTYQESNPFNNSQSVINITQAGKWDFSLQADYDAPFGTDYCFRCAKTEGTGTANMNYNLYPLITTKDAQDDANSGDDAGNTSAIGLAISPGAYTGNIWTATDVDYYNLSVTSGKSYTVILQPPQPDDYDLAIHNSTDQLKWLSAKTQNQEEKIRFTADETGNWFIKVFDYNSADSNKNNTYNLTLLNTTLYYVRQDGNDGTGVKNGNPNVASQCFQTIQGAFTKLKTDYANNISGQGEVVVSVRKITSADYASADLQGLITNFTGRFALENYTGEKPVINGSTSTYALRTGYGAQGDGNMSYVTVSGFYLTAQNLTFPMMRIFQNNLTSGQAIVEKCVFDGQNITRDPASFFFGLLFVPINTNSIVRNNEFKNIKTNLNPNAVSGVMFTSPVQNSQNIFIQDNIFHDNDAEVILVSGALNGSYYFNATIERNRIYNNTVNSTLIFLSENRKNYVFRNNMVYNNNLGRATGGLYPDTLFVGNCTNTSIDNNVFYLNNASTAEIRINATSSSGVEVKNNIIWANTTGKFCLWVESGAQTNFTSANNAFYVDFANNGYPGGSTLSTSENTETVCNWTGTATTTSVLNTKPGSIGNGYALGGLGLVSSTDMHITNSSLCKDAGVTLASVLDDVDGVARPQGASYDIGASEYMATAVKLVSFNALGLSGKVEVKWKTASEFNNIGFNIYVSSSKDGPYSKVNSGIISGLSNSFRGNEYTLIDTNVTNGNTYYYKLEDLEVGGTSTMHGPVEAHPGKDSDGDGMTDDWEKYYGLNTSDPSDATGDLDADMITNLQEFQQDKNPAQSDLAAAQEAAAAALASQGVHIISSDNTGIILELNTTNFTSTDRVINATTYQSLNIPGYSYGYTGDIGLAKMPFKPVLLGIPLNSTCQVEVLSSDLQEAGNYTVEPVIEYSVSASDLQSAVISGGYSTVGPVNILTNTSLINAAFYAQNSLYPQNLASVEYVGDLRSQRVASINVNPLRFNPAQRSISFARTIRLKLSFVYGSAEQGVPAQITYDRDAKLKIYTTQTGMHKLTWDNLYNAGLNELMWKDPRTIKLANNGQELAIRVVGEDDGTFNYGDYIEFYAQANPSKYSKYNVYWLSFGTSNGKRMENVASSPDPATDTPGNYRYSKHLENNNYYWSNRLGNESADRWFWSPEVWNGTKQNYTVSLKDVDTADPLDTVNLTVSYYAFFNNSHQTKSYLNNNLLDDSLWSNADERVVSLSFPQSQLLEGNNTISLENKIVSPVVYDAIIANYFDLEYSRKFIAENDSMAFTYNAAGLTVSQFNLTGFTNQSMEVYDVTDPYAVRNITGFSTNYELDNTYTLNFKSDFQEQETRNFTVLTPAKLNLIDHIVYESSVTNLTDTANQADYLMITHADFKDSLAPLKAHYEQTGLKVMVVDVMDIYDEFNSGIPSPQAIKDFLGYTYTKWQHPAPTYVLLVGDAHYDFRDNSNTGKTIYMPAYLIPNTPNMGETASDNWFVCLDGETDILADMMIGRLPVRTAAEADNMVRKILEYSNSTLTGYYKNVTFSSDRDSIFEGVSNTLDQYLLDDMSGEKLYLSSYADNAKFTQDIIDSMEMGTLIFNYVGHGSTNLWTSNSLFATATIPQVDNPGKYFFLTTFDCLDGYFLNLDANYESLAETFVRQADSGAIAAFSPAGFGFPPGHQILSNELYKALFTDRITQPGAAILKSKAQLFSIAGTQLQDLIQTYNYFGDPALSLKIPAIEITVPGTVPGIAPGGTTTAPNSAIETPSEGIFDQVLGSALVNSEDSEKWRDENKKSKTSKETVISSGQGTDEKASLTKKIKRILKKAKTRILGDQLKKATTGKRASLSRGEEEPVEEAVVEEAASHSKLKAFLQAAWQALLDFIRNLIKTILKK